MILILKFFFVNELIENNLEKRPHPNPLLIGEGIEILELAC